ncbi:MAG: LysE family translocator [Pseudomonadota bacterium]
MSADMLLAFALFAFVTSVTPGPNNIMLLASGVNFGFRATIPHILGISTGFLFMVIAVGLGLTEVFARYPLSYIAMRWIGVVYLLYLAWTIAHAGAPKPRDHASSGRPLGYWGAAAFQWVNPKAWAMAVGAFSAYVPANSSMAMVVGIAVLFAVINGPSVSVWAVCGSQMRQFFQVPRYQRIFNYSMAALLLISMVPLLNTSKV